MSAWLAGRMRRPECRSGGDRDAGRGINFSSADPAWRIPHRGDRLWLVTVRPSSAPPFARDHVAWPAPRRAPLAQTRPDLRSRIGRLPLSGSSKRNRLQESVRCVTKEPMTPTRQTRSRPGAVSSSQRCEQLGSAILAAKDSPLHPGNSKPKEVRNVAGRN
jgi:hypothetical protein